MSIRFIALVSVLFLLRPTSLVRAQNDNKALRFYGLGKNDTDRVKIRVDGPETLADIGASDFTIEWWMKANLADNPGNTACSGEAG